MDAYLALVRAGDGSRVKFRPRLATISTLRCACNSRLPQLARSSGLRRLIEPFEGRAANCQRLQRGRPVGPDDGDCVVPSVVIFKTTYEDDARGIPPTPYIPRDYSRRD